MSALDLLRTMDGPARDASAWLVTYLLHATLLLVAARCVVPRLRSGPLREALWSIALVGGLATASVQMATGANGWVLRLGWSDEARSSSVASAPGAHAPQRARGVEEASPASAAIVAAGELDPVGPTIGVSGAGGSGASARTLAWPSLVPAAWAIGAALALRRLLAASRRARRALAGRERVRPGALVDALERLRIRASLPRPIALSISPALASPCALSSREICLPTRARHELAPEELEAVLAHELAHVARRDPLRARLVALVEALLWMQPLNRMAARALREEAELRCDAWAARRTAEPLALARSLERVAGWLADGAQAAPAAAMIQRESALVRRVEHLLGDPAKSLSLLERASYSVGAALALTLVVGFAPAARLRALAGQEPRRGTGEQLGGLGYVQEGEPSREGASPPAGGAAQERPALARGLGYVGAGDPAGDPLQQLRGLGYVGVEQERAIFARIEIAGDGRMERDGRVLFDTRAPDDFARLRSELEAIAASMRKRDPDPARPDAPPVPDEWLALRVDAAARAHWLLKAMEQCGRTRIWRLQLERALPEGATRTFDVLLPGDTVAVDVDTLDGMPVEGPTSRRKFELRIDVEGGDSGQGAGERRAVYRIAVADEPADLFSAVTIPSVFVAPGWQLELRGVESKVPGEKGRVLVGSRTERVEGLLPTFRALREWKPARWMSIEARRGTLWSDVTPALEAAEAAGIPRLTFVGSYE